MSLNQTQEMIDQKLNIMLNVYQDLFSGRCKIKLSPIHIYTIQGRAPVGQKLRPVALHLMEPLRADKRRRAKITNTDDPEYAEVG